MESLKIEKQGDLLVIGEEPQLVICLKTQDHYIKTGAKKIPYKRKILLSQDLLEGKREQVLETAVRYYYKQASSIVQGIAMAEEFKKKANLTQREKM